MIDLINSISQNKRTILPRKMRFQNFLTNIINLNNSGTYRKCWQYLKSTPKASTSESNWSLCMDRKVDKSLPRTNFQGQRCGNFNLDYTFKLRCISWDIEAWKILVVLSNLLNMHSQPYASSWHLFQSTFGLICTTKISPDLDRDDDDIYLVWWSENYQHEYKGFPSACRRSSD